MISFWNIARNTFTDFIRQPIYLVLLLSSSIGIILLGNVYYFALGDDLKLVKDSSLSVMLLTGLFGAVFGASSSVAKELKGGTAMVLLSKPVNRAQFLLAKFSGISLGLSLMLCLNVQSSVLASRMAFDVYGEPDYAALGLYGGSVAAALSFAGAINFLFRRPYARDAVWSLLFFLSAGFFLNLMLGPDEAVRANETAFDWNLVSAGVLILFALCLLGGLSVALATRLEAAPVFVICCVFFLLGLMSDYLFGRWAEQGNMLAGILYAALPNWQVFWMADAVEESKTIPASYLFQALLYTLVQLTALFGLAMILFEERDLA